MTKTEPRSAGSGGGRDKTQPTPTELLAKIADAHAFFARNPDLRMTTGDHARYAEKLGTLATTLSAREDGWQPIETAPTSDGTILIGWGQYRELDGFSPAFMRWYDSVSCWTVNAIQFYPTHWQPLPNAPTSGEGDEHQ